MSDDSDQARARAVEDAELELAGQTELVALTQPLFVELSAADVMLLVGLVQLALRHPEIEAETRRAAATFVDAARGYFANCPAVLEMIRRGEVDNGLETVATVAVEAKVLEEPKGVELVRARVRLVAALCALPPESFDFFCGVAINMGRTAGGFHERDAVERFGRIASAYLDTAAGEAGRSASGPTVERAPITLPRVVQPREGGDE